MTDKAKTDTTKTDKEAKIEKNEKANVTETSKENEVAKKTQEAPKEKRKSFAGRKREGKSSRRIDDFEERIVQIKRVSKKTKGGNTIRFTALAVVGNKHGLVGTGYGKGSDVTTAISKAISQARDDLVEVPITGKTIPHEVSEKYKSAEVLLKPAPEGSGIIAGGSIRIVAELAGIQDISAKMLGSNNKICNVMGSINALRKLKKVK